MPKRSLKSRGCGLPRFNKLEIPREYPVLMKNPFDHSRPNLPDTKGKADSGKGPQRKIPPRSSMSLSSTSAGLEVMGHGAAKNDYKNRVSGSGRKPASGRTAKVAAKRKVTGDNYAQVYLEQEAAAKAAAEQKASAQKTANNPFEKRKAEAKMAEARKVEAYRGRARDLQNQISGLRQQLGQNPDVDSRTQANIDNLSRELNGIPTIYWN